MVEEPLREAEIGGCEIWRNGSGQGLVGTRGEWWWYVVKGLSEEVEEPSKMEGKVFMWRVFNKIVYRR